MKKHTPSRFLSLMLAICMMLSFAVPAHAESGLSWQEVDSSAAIDLSSRQVTANVQTAVQHKDTDQVRVSIVLEEKPTIQAGYATMGIAQNHEAMAYRDRLEAKQETMAQRISTQVLGGQELDVVWNMALVGNIISANVPYGKLEEIRALDGVQDVFLEQRYEPQVDAAGDEPQTYVSGGMTGARVAWNSGYTGAGSRIAVIDTGTDTDHQLFDSAAFQYALEENAKKAGKSYDSYVKDLDLLDEEELKAVLPKLHAFERTAALTADQLYRNLKLPFGYNYIDQNLNITHDADGAGGHGSHVAGIATGNRYLSDGDAYVSAGETVYATGAAPDAQLITMKVFGAKGGAYESDYMVALEDAILLNCDSVNLSLGTASPGFAYNDTYTKLLDSLEETGTVVVISAGNSGYWVEHGETGGYLYHDSANFSTGGSPGSYDNALTVASVDNAGAVGPYMQVQDQIMVYTENLGFGNQRLAALDVSTAGTGTELPWLFVEGFGQAADFEGMDLKGKVVFCSRGGGVSFVDKANAAAERGAAAVVVYNNEPGALGMDLTGYRYQVPCVSITQNEGAAVKAAGTAATTSSGLTYYTGTLKICSQTGVSQYDWSAMSSFSSWGVPGTLTLKPEITAPGGNILSVNGETKDTDKYVVQSGTSMAAPQVSGLAALMAQYIRENNLEEQTGLTLRTLTQSLLMSTAQPLYDENGLYYSILNQGAGLTKVDAAMAARSYVLVNGQPDGKVKAELGDDPDRTGSYHFSFTLHNLTEEDRDYALSGDVFTQDVFQNEDIWYLDTATRALSADVSFRSNGSLVVSPDAVVAHDLNGDGKTDAQDADYLLEYLLGNEKELKANGDVNGDGEVNTYDAHVLLAMLEGKACVTVPAGGQVQVEVSLTLPRQVKEYLDTATPKGAYLEAFVYAKAVADAEGNEGETHSIPVLGFYGSWTDSSMYDVGTPIDRAYEIDTRPSYLGAISNRFTMTYGGKLGEFDFGGNPVTKEAEYLPERNALNNINGDALHQLLFAPIRNAGNVKFRIRNTETGETYVDEELGSCGSAFYYVNGGTWQNIQMGLNVAWDCVDAQGNRLPEGTPVEISLICAPEYYRNADGSYDWDALGQGAYLSTQFTIDNTAPKATDIALSMTGQRELRVRATDNAYVAAVALLNASGTKTLQAIAPNQKEAGEEVSATLSLEGRSGNKFLVAVYDYAMNQSVYEVKLDQSSETVRPYFTAVNRTTKYEDYLNWVGFDAAEGQETLLADILTGTPRAAEYVDGYVFAITDDDKLMLASDEDLTGFTELTTLNGGEYPVHDFRDLAYNKVDGKLYGLYYSNANKSAKPYLCTIDVLTGAIEVLGELGQDLDALTIDGEGHFYGKPYGGSTLYTYTVDTFQNPTKVGDMGSYTSRALNSMAWDHNDGKLYWGCCADGTTKLLEIDPATAKATLVRELPFTSVGLYIRPPQGHSIFQPTNQVDGVSLNQTSAKVLVGETVQLTAKVLPWTVTNGNVTWSSSSDDIATVSESGFVMAKAPGTATITAASVLDPTKTAAFELEVYTIHQTLNSLVWDKDGSIWWSQFDTDKLPNYTKLAQAPSDIRLASAAYGADGKLYAATMDADKLESQFYSVDTETWEATLLGPATLQDRVIGYMDLAYAPNLGEGGSMLAVYGPNVVTIDAATGACTGGWSYGQESLVGIAYCDSTYDNKLGTNRDGFFLIDAAGNVYYDAFYVDAKDGEYYNLTGNQGVIGNMGTTTDAPYFSSAYFDGQYLFWSKYSKADNRTDLIVWDSRETGGVSNLGSFQEGVWPVGGLFQLDKSPAAGTSYDALLENAEGSAALQPEELELLRADHVPGGLHAATASEAAKTSGKQSKTITVTIPASQETTNGRMTFSYDTDKLAFTGISSPLDVYAETTEAGTVEFAYAAAHAVTKDATLAILNFQIQEGASGKTDLQVKTSECNEEAVDTAETISVELSHNCPSAAFTDLNTNAWYHAYTDYVIAHGFMKGMDTTHFAPEKDLTRGQMVTTLYRLAGEPEVTEPATFTDVAMGRYYTKAIAWAEDLGIAKGMTDTTFAPEGTVTRQQAATFLYRYVTECLEQEPAEGADLKDFRDGSSVMNYAKTAMCWAVAEGFFEGYGDGTLRPAATLTRAQMAKLLTILDQNF